MPLLVLAFIVVPLVELYAIIQVGHAIGALPTIALLLADSVLGALLMRSQGRAAWRSFQAALASGRPPAREVLDGVLVVFGGALLLTPGFVTDLLGVGLLLPPTRALARRRLVGRFAGRVAGGTAKGFRFPAAGRPRPQPRYEDTVEGTAHEVRDPPRLP